MARVARLHIRLAEQLIAAPLELAVARPNGLQTWLDVLGELTQLVQIMRLRAVERAHQKKTVIEALGGLMQLKRCYLRSFVCHRVMKLPEELIRSFEPLVIILARL